jgi:hypothetical protein
MVLSGASKMARNQAKIINRQTCGGNAKGGLAPRTNLPVSMRLKHILVRIQTTVRNQLCIPSITNQTQKYGYRATHTGRMG